MKEPSNDNQDSKNTNGPIFLDDENELSTDVPTFYQALGVSDKVRTRLSKILKETEKQSDNDQDIKTDELDLSIPMFKV